MQDASLSDAGRIASVLPDWVFVQMPGVAKIKFKLSVAGGLHLAAAGSQSGTT
jgi:hypothetical protein